MTLNSKRVKTQKLQTGGVGKYQEEDFAVSCLTRVQITLNQDKVGQNEFEYNTGAELKEVNIPTLAQRI